MLPTGPCISYAHLLRVQREEHGAGGAAECQDEGVALRGALVAAVG